MIDLNKPIRNKSTGEVVEVDKHKIFIVKYITRKSFGTYTTVPFNEHEFYLTFENVPEKEYTFQEACEELIKGNAKKMIRVDCTTESSIRSSFELTINKEYNDMSFVNGTGNSFKFAPSDIQNKWKKVK